MSICLKSQNLLMKSGEDLSNLGQTWKSKQDNWERHWENSLCENITLWGTLNLRYFCTLIQRKSWTPKEKDIPENMWSKERLQLHFQRLGSKKECLLGAGQRRLAGWNTVTNLYQFVWNFLITALKVTSSRNRSAIGKTGPLVSIMKRIRCVYFPKATGSEVP